MFHIAHDQLCWLLVFPLLGAAAGFLLTSSLGRKAGIIAGLTGPVGVLVTTIILQNDLLYLVPGKRRFLQEVTSWLTGKGAFGPISLIFDPLSSLLVATAAVCILMVALTEWSANQESRSNIVFLNLLLLSLVSAFTAENLIFFVAAWMATSFFGVCLTTAGAQACELDHRLHWLISRIADVALLAAALILMRIGGGFGFLEIGGGILENARHIPSLAVRATTMTILVVCVIRLNLLPFGLLQVVGPASNPAWSVVLGTTFIPALYLIARLAPMFVLGTAALSMLSLLAAVSALVFAINSLLQRKLSRVISSTILTHIALVCVVLGKGSFSAAIEHAAFLSVAATCALLSVFLVNRRLFTAGAGEDADDLEAMGGLGTRLPLAFILMSASLMALAGVPPFATFFSLHGVIWDSMASAMRQTTIARLTFAALTLSTIALLLANVRTFFGAFRGRPEVLHDIEPIAPRHLPGVVFGLTALLAATFISRGGELIGLDLSIKHAMNISVFSQTKMIAAEKIRLGSGWLSYGFSMLYLLGTLVGCLVLGWLAYWFSAGSILSRIPFASWIVTLFNRQLFLTGVICNLIVKPIYALSLVTAKLGELLSRLVAVPGLLLARFWRQSSQGDSVS